MKLLSVATLFFLIACTPSQKKDQVLAPGDFQRQLQKTPGAVLVDVRRPDELTSGKIAGARNIVFGTATFEHDMLQLEKSPIFVYCAGGVRSAKAASLLREQGYQVYELEGGLKNWTAEGLPLVKP